MTRIGKYRIRKANGRFHIDANLGKVGNTRTWLPMSSYPSYFQAAQRVDHLIMAEIAATVKLKAWNGK